MFNSALHQKISATDNSDGVHQAILNVAFADWQAENDWSLEDMVSNAGTKYGKLARFAVQVGKYNQQVTNGGHEQYYDNGYASNGGGCFSGHEGFALHEQMIRDFEKFEIASKTTDGEEVLAIMKEMLHVGPGDCPDCEGAGGWDEETEIDIEDEDGEITTEYGSDWEDCWSCGGTGTDDRDCSIGYTDHLDTRYYKVYDRFMEELEALFKKELDKKVEN